MLQKFNAIERFSVGYKKNVPRRGKGGYGKKCEIESTAGDRGRLLIIVFVYLREGNIATRPLCFVTVEKIRILDILL